MGRISVLEFGLATQMQEPSENSEGSVLSLTFSGHGREVVFQLGIQAVLQTVVTQGLRTTTRTPKFHNAQSINFGVNSVSCKNPPHPARLRSLQRRGEGCCWHFLPVNREK